MAARMPPVRGRYDAAQTSDNNARHWQWADNFSARAANSPQVRRVLRNRTRYEIANNCYASGIVETLADETVGSGPLLQMMTRDKVLDRTIEFHFGQWATEILFADKLHTMHEARSGDGESFMFLETDPSLGDIQLDLCLYEADQVATPYLYPPLNPRVVDGIELNEHDKPVAYHLLNEHPGDTMAYTLGFEYTRIPARYVIHWFRRRRPGQFRGIPHLTPALGLFAQLRRYGIATLSSAEAAAAFSAVVYTDMPPQAGIQAVEPFEGFDYEHGMFTTLPAGWKMGQFDAKQPTANHEMFKRSTIQEIARALKIPYSIAAGDWSGENYASGRLGNQTFHRSILVDQSRIRRETLDRVLKEWLMEADKATTMIKGGINRPGGFPHRWIWPGIEHVDPLKEANAQQKRLQSLTTTFTDECYMDGVDPDERMELIESEIAEFKRRGIPIPYGIQSPGGAGAQQPAGNQQDQQGQQGEEIDDGGDDDTTGGQGSSAGDYAGRNGFHRH